MLDNSKIHVVVYFTTDDIYNWQDFLQSIAFEGLFYGFQSVFYTMTLFIFSRRGLNSSYSQICLLAAATIMFLCSSCMFLKDLVDIILQIKSFPDTSSSVEMQLWFGGHGFYLTGDQTASVVDVYIQITNSPAENTGWAWIILPVCLVFTNLVATLLIAVRAWHYRHFLQKNQTENPGKGRIEKFFVLLIESGGVYCLLWVVYGVMEGVAPRFIGTDVVAGLGTHVSCLHTVILHYKGNHYHNLFNLHLQKILVDWSIQKCLVPDHQSAPREVDP
ncbi:hypothetical protein K435DRAFT_808206 [Dendrothele bispora CBS 962.96]|uniref:Uncharacterized protein n=1 Tax=Dendrothele bispora (strain CBS 962.96) TaxID=1314807 RepID=A0A4S8L276_DENBC|nr:hypothetical protein K435DRAFT_808206 [Dendrothele bispora CBS 962.96]